VIPLDPRLLRHARATGTYVAATAGIGVLTALLVIVQAGLLAHGITAAYLEGADLADLRPTLVGLAAVLAARVALAWVQESAAYRASAAVKASLRSQLVERAVRLGPSWLSGQRTGELTTLVTRGVDALDGYFAKYLPQLVLAVIVPVAVLARIVTEDWIATVTIVLTLPLIPMFMVLVGKATQAHTERQWRTLTRLGHHFLDVVAGLATLKVFGRAKAQVATIRAVTDDYRRASMATLRVAFLSALVLELLATLSVALVAVGIGLRLVEGRLDLETGLLILILAPEAYLPLRMVGVHYHSSAEGMEAAQRAFDVLEQQPTAAGAARLGRPVLVEARQVSVSYPGRSQPAVHEVDLDLRSGEVVALAGPSGGGKSSLVAALMGFVPVDGQIRVTDEQGRTQPLADLDLEAWRAQVGWTPQRPHLFAASLADNLRLARPDADAAMLHAALADAAAEDVVAGLPLGLDTPLGDGGVGLSAGQRRRVALARAFLRDAPVLVLDEPTADLDRATESRVLAAIRARADKGAAVLLVAHRPGLLAWADRVVPVEGAGGTREPVPVPVSTIGFGAGL
jgi:ATP-binding cassette, subfamily C, bacterial CydCD